MKIKTKKQLNLPQLIEWAWENNITNQEFFCDGFEEKSAIFNLSGWAEFSDEFSYNPHDTFTVETEEELTEDTVIDEMLLVYDNGVTHIAENKNLSFISKGNLKSAYYMNDDLRLILIWRDGKLVE